MIVRSIVRFALITVGGWIVTRVVDSIMTKFDEDDGKKGSENSGKGK